MVGPCCFKVWFSTIACMAIKPATINPKSDFLGGHLVAYIGNCWSRTGVGPTYENSWICHCNQTIIAYKQEIWPLKKKINWKSVRGGGVIIDKKESNNLFLMDEYDGNKISSLMSQLWVWKKLNAKRSKQFF